MNNINRIIKAFIFDMDGVLTDTVELHYITWKRLAAEEGVPFNRELNEKLRGLSREDSIRLVFKGRQLPEHELQRLFLKKNEYFLELAAQMTEADLLPGVKDLLNEVKQRGYQIALASSSKNTKIIINNLGIGSYFESISDGYSVKLAKPAPDLFLHAASSLGTKPESCIVVEDAAAGIEGAHAAKMKVIGIGPPERVGQADFRFDAVAEIDVAKVIAEFQKFN